MGDSVGFECSCDSGRRGGVAWEAMNRRAEGRPAAPPRAEGPGEKTRREQRIRAVAPVSRPPSKKAPKDSEPLKQCLVGGCGGDTLIIHSIPDWGASAGAAAQGVMASSWIRPVQLLLAARAAGRDVEGGEMRFSRRAIQLDLAVARPLESSKITSSSAIPSRRARWR